MPVLHETFLVPVHMYDSETMLWKEKERSRIRAVQIDNLRGLLGIRRMDRIQNAQIREFCLVKKGLDERIDEGVLKWYGHVERMERYRNAKRVYIGECAGSCPVGRLWKRWIDTVWMSGKQSEWCRIGVNGGVCEGKCMRLTPRDEPLTLMRCHSCGLP